ncbi:MAG: class II aldolase/adducin family protein, partial [Clostridia bacterium]|nr:class II aldolase/adducin family protein [Clostridia bacterium]
DHKGHCELSAHDERHDDREQQHQRRADGDADQHHKPFHRDIYKLRPDLGAILHAHPPTLVAFSLARKIPETRLVPSVSAICGEVSMAPYEVPGSEKLGEYLSAEFAKGFNTVMMENHGVCCGAQDLFHAFMAFETLDFCGRIEIDARKLGEPHLLTPTQITMDSSKSHPPLDAFIARQISSEECAARRDMCQLIHRAYDQRLFNSTQGTFSQRLSDGSFLITPYKKDRKYLEPEDLVRIKNGMCEEGKTPSRSALLHKAIYERHPETGSVIIAHPPAIMAFACTDATFDSRTIPESYINLRDVKRMPYASSSMDVEGTADALCETTPVIIIDNQCVIVAGSTLLNAFDRLEVLDYSAKAIIAARDIGPLVMISPEQVKDIETAFNL